MRCFIFILMIALLPLRGWMGEAMATEMVAMHLIASQATNTQSTVKFNTENSIYNELEVSADFAISSAAMSADCEIHAKSVLDTPPSKQLCSHCQACHAVGLADTVQIISHTAAHNPAPAAHASLFVSADLAPGQKPPIL